MLNQDVGNVTPNSIIIIILLPSIQIYILYYTYCSCLSHELFDVHVKQYLAICPFLFSSHSVGLLLLLCCLFSSSDCCVFFSSFYFYISSALLIVYISCISLFSRILLFPLPSFLIILKRAHRHTQTLFSVAFATNSLSGTRRCVRECDTPSTQWNNSWQEWVDCNALHEGERKKKNCSTE